MELFLNAVWLALAAVTLGGWLSVWAFARDDRRLVRGLVVLGCALFLLFPVISMTDDLAAQQVASEDASRTSKKALETGEWLTHKASPTAIVTPLGAAQNPHWQALGFVLVEDQTCAASVRLVPSPARAPPSFV